MSENSLSLLQAMTTKMEWLENRHKKIAENIANADTPNFKPGDIKPLEFKVLVKSVESKKTGGLSATDPAHISSSSKSSSTHQAAEKTAKNSYEVSPAGNAVVLEEELLKINENMTQHRLISTLYQKNIDLIKSSIRNQ